MTSGSSLGLRNRKKNLQAFAVCAALFTMTPDAGQYLRAAATRRRSIYPNSWVLPRNLTRAPMILLALLSYRLLAICGRPYEVRITKIPVNKLFIVLWLRCRVRQSYSQFEIRSHLFSFSGTSMDFSWYVYSIADCSRCCSKSNQLIMRVWSQATDSHLTRLFHASRLIDFGENVRRKCKSISVSSVQMRNI